MLTLRKKRREVANASRYFNRPKLPIAWITTTFIAPAMVIILPSLFSSDDTSFTTRVILALVLLSLLLIVACFSLILNLYDVSYNCQILEFKFEQQDIELTLQQNKLKAVEEQLIEFASSNKDEKLMQDLEEIRTTTEKWQQYRE